MRKSGCDIASGKKYFEPSHQSIWLYPFVTKFVYEEIGGGHRPEIIEGCHDMGIPLPPLPPALVEPSSSSLSRGPASKRRIQ